MSTLPDFLSEALAGPPRERAFGERLAGSAWAWTSSARMLDRAGDIAWALAGAGVAPGDRVALIANNCVDWLVADFGTFFAGGVVVPIFATLAPDQIDYILRDSEAKLCFVASEAEARRLRPRCAATVTIVHFEGSGPESLAVFEASGRAARADSSRAHPVDGVARNPDALAVLIYTSGTTGDPKGVMLSHRNLISNALAARAMLPASMGVPGQPVISVLPFAHIYEHTLINLYTRVGAQIFITQPEYLARDLKDARPVLAAVVPRILERVLAGIVGKAKLGGGPKSVLVPWALAVGRDYADATQNGRSAKAGLALRYALAQKLVLSKVRPAIGLDRLQFFGSGSAPLHRDTALTFASMGVPIAEGYGLTETSPIVTLMPTDAIRYGTVGRAIADVEIAIAGDGEILVRGPNVMLGYYHLPNDRSVDADGWFATGDIGALDDDGYLTITDRKKELIKTSAGKYVAPGRVESALKRSVYVGQCFVIGDGRPHPMALVSPNWDLIRAEFGIPADTPTATIASREDVRDFVGREVVEKSADLASFESVRRIALLPRDLTIEDGELSPTMKIKRRVVETKFAALIDDAYASSKSSR